MRVLHVMADAAESGLEAVMLAAVAALAEAGLEQQVLARSGDPGALRQAPAAVTVAPFDRLWKRRTVAALQRALQGFRPQVVHYWSGEAAAFAPPGAQGRSLGWYAAYEPPSRFRACGWHAGQTPEAAHHIAAQGVAGERIAVLARFARPPAAPAPLERATLDTPESAPLAFHESRFEPDCGVETLLRALLAAPRVHAWIAGDGPLLRPMRALAGELQLEGRVRFLGARPDRAALLAASDVVLFPEPLRPLDNAVIEAWAGERPVVLCGARGPAGPIEPERDGLLAEPARADSLAGALLRVLEDGDLAARLARNGRLRFEREFSQTAFTRAALALYERIAEAGAHAANAAAASVPGAA